MDIRIDIETEGPVDIVHVSGRLVGSSIKQLTDSCESIGDNFVLDLSKLMFADEAAADTIRALCGRAAEIRGASPFINLLIHREHS
jgi:anti-anti-sigma regulatory factor